MIRRKNLFSILIGLVILVCIAGCTTPAFEKNTTQPILVSPSNPESGIQNWIDAFNARNIDLVYNMSPDEIKKQISLSDFRKANVNNSLLNPGNTFLNFTAYDKTQNGTYAQIKAQILLKIPPNPNNTNGTLVPVQYTFALFFEHGEWKVWTI